MQFTPMTIFPQEVSRCDFLLQALGLFGSLCHCNDIVASDKIVGNINVYVVGAILLPYADRN